MSSDQISAGAPVQRPECAERDGAAWIAAAFVDQAVPALALHIDQDQSTHGDWRYVYSMSSDAIAPPLCPDCREPMKLVKTIPHVGGLPEIFVFYCSRCKQAETKLLEKAA